MSDAGPKQPPGPQSLVLFDGVCNLCNAAVQWLITRDSELRLRYASLQSEAARAALHAAGVEDPVALGESIVFVDGSGRHLDRRQARFSLQSGQSNAAGPATPS